jgi:hypothetical protein
MVDAAVAEDLEVLGLAPVGGVGVGEAVGHADAFHGLLGDAVDLGGLGRPGRLQDGRGDVDDVIELVALLALGRMPRGQWTMAPLRVPPQWEATCLVHW